MSQSWDIFLDDGDNDATDGNANNTTDNSYMSKTGGNDFSSNPKFDNNNNSNQQNSNNGYLGQPQFNQHEKYDNNVDMSTVDENQAHSASAALEELNNYNDDSAIAFATPPSSRPYMSQQHYADTFNQNMFPSSLSSSGNFTSFHPQGNHLSHRAATIPRYQTPPPLPVQPMPQPSFITPAPMMAPNNNNTDLSNNNPTNNANVGEYYFVQFHPNRTLLVKNTPKIALDQEDYVITEADRGFDIGRVVKNETHPLEKDVIAARNIIRKATPYEISMIPNKEEREKNARNVCQEKADELGLPMKITATELQFDGKKLTVYFSANQYIDFRNLVHTLFREFGTRIWMVWFDGTSPVRDVFTHSTRERRFTME